MLTRYRDEKFHVKENIDYLFYTLNVRRLIFLTQRGHACLSLNLHQGLQYIEIFIQVLNKRNCFFDYEKGYITKKEQRQEEVFNGHHCSELKIICIFFISVLHFSGSSKWSLGSWDYPHHSSSIQRPSGSMPVVLGISRDVLKDAWVIT